MIHVDDAEWPIVGLRWAGDVSLGDIERLVEQLRVVQTKRGPFIIVSDLTELRAASATARIRQAVAEAADELVERGALLSAPALRVFGGQQNLGHSQIGKNLGVQAQKLPVVLLRYGYHVSRRA